MKYRIKKQGPEQAVGGFDKGIGELQFEFLVEQGLSPSNHLLDIGCGSLRGGRYFLEYLEAGNYTGMDISEEVIEAGLEKNRSAVEENDPTFIVNDDLQFDEVNNSFEYAIAQSVFTHLPLEQVEECLENIDKVVDGTFYATVFVQPRNNPKDFVHNINTLIELAKDQGHSAELLSQEAYPHPNGQGMVAFKIARS